MTISGTAKANHDELFGDRISTLAQTDAGVHRSSTISPSDEILADAADLDDSVDLHIWMLVQLAAVLAAGGLASSGSSAQRGWPRRITPVECRTCLSRVPYVGEPRVRLPAAPTTCSPRRRPYCHCRGQATTAHPRPGRHRAAGPERIVGAGRVDQMHRRRPTRCEAFPALPDRRLLR